jgi:hypothetical protein
MVGGNKDDPTRPDPPLTLSLLANGETTVSIREYRNLRTQYKKSEKTLSNLSRGYEVSCSDLLVVSLFDLSAIGSS